MSANSGRTSTLRPATKATAARNHPRCREACDQHTNIHHSSPSQAVTRPFSRPEVAKSRAGGIAMYTSTPAGSINARRLRRAGAHNRAVPNMTIAMPTTLSASASASATYSSRIGPPTRLAR